MLQDDQNQTYRKGGKEENADLPYGHRLGCLVIVAKQQNKSRLCQCKEKQI